MSNTRVWIRAKQNSNPVDYSSGAATDSHRTSLLSGIKHQHRNRIRYKFYMKNYFGVTKIAEYLINTSFDYSIVKLSRLQI